jgi:hypothetical protein
MGNGDIVVDWGGDQTRLKGLVLISSFERRAYGNFKLLLGSKLERQRMQTSTCVRREI